MLPFPGPGGAGNGGIPTLARPATAACFAPGVRCVVPECSLCPGAEAAAIPAKTPLRTVDTATAAPVSPRVLAASASRAATRCLIPVDSYIGQVEQGWMNGA